MYASAGSPGIERLIRSRAAELIDRYERKGQQPSDHAPLIGEL